MKKLGFTLAEVLITLVIIGVIAAMTVPTLMNNTQGTENKTAFKKAISSLNQALTLEYALEGNTAASVNIIDIMKKRTNVINTKGEWYTGTTKDAATDGILVTADGMIYKFIEEGHQDGCSGEPPVDGSNIDTFDIYSSSHCAFGYVDVNGVKGPNKMVTNSAKPEDQFTFLVFATKVIPGTTVTSVERAVMYDDKTVTPDNVGPSAPTE